MKRTRRLIVVLMAFILTALAALLRRFPPGTNFFYPRCPVRAYLHLDCPGCGATRALASLLQGHLGAAVHENALFVILLPLLAAYGILAAYRAWTAEIYAWPSPPPWTTAAAIIAAIIFTVARNLPA